MVGDLEIALRTKRNSRRVQVDFTRDKAPSFFFQQKT
jgi:hypothetical protein